MATQEIPVDIAKERKVISRPEALTRILRTMKALPSDADRSSVAQSIAELYAK